MTETVAKLKELIARREQIEETVAQFEHMTISRVVQGTQLDILDSDDSDDDVTGAGNQASMNSSKSKLVTSGTGADLHKETDSKHKKKISSKKSEKEQTSETSGKKWSYESSATPPAYKLEVLDSAALLAVTLLQELTLHTSYRQLFWRLLLKKRKIYFMSQEILLTSDFQIFFVSCFDIAKI